MGSIGKFNLNLIKENWCRINFALKIGKKDFSMKILELNKHLN